MKVLAIVAIVFAVAFAGKVPDAPKPPVVGGNSSLPVNSSVPVPPGRTGRLLLLATGNYVDIDREVIVPAKEVVISRQPVVVEREIPIRRSEYYYTYTV